MNTFHLLGYTTDKSYSLQSKTNVGHFALIKVLSPAVKGIYYGALSITLSNITVGSTSVTSIYFGNNKIL